MNLWMGALFIVVVVLLAGCVRLLIQRASLNVILAKERESAAEKQALLQATEARFSDTFKALSAEALKSNNQAFLDLAKSSLEKFQETAKGDLEKRQEAIQHTLTPVKESLQMFDAKIQDLEKARVGAYESLSQQVKGLMEAQSSLIQALRTPRVRGRWGEIQLKRVVELAGMLDHCDFYEQKNVATDEGRLRPDLVVRLPGGRHIVVDSKVPLESFLDAYDTKDDTQRAAKLLAHAKRVREHITALSRKAYWEQFQPAPDFVVLFLPGESIFLAALEADPSLIEEGADQRILIATPTSLIALLRSFALGWRQVALEVNAQEICDLGREIYKRLGDMSEHFSDLGLRLGKAVEAYNKTLGSLETRVLATARRLVDLKAADKPISETIPLTPIDLAPRIPQTPGLTLKSKN